MSDDDELQGKRTEYVTREYNAEGQLVKEVRTTTIEHKPDVPDDEIPGCFL